MLSFLPITCLPPSRPPQQVPDIYHTGPRVPSPRPTLALRPYPSSPSPLCPNIDPRPASIAPQSLTPRRDSAVAPDTELWPTVLYNR
ncbi:hypothetical protein AZE42_03230 [Rhizopogon vesiculosus]|uniref:Uncharacterized protein n=1 Tax=Rhizopogon vesiculosus TaxID=180088 RepID=A0A1J8Q2R6_9AGAM|nr:hypothetical protein AZE42_03230 [Rhizopogon vesiculosus]